jgi:hypothetical protein
VRWSRGFRGERGAGHPSASGVPEGPREIPDHRHFLQRDRSREARSGHGEVSGPAPEESHNLRGGTQGIERLGNRRGGTGSGLGHAPPIGLRAQIMSPSRKELDEAAAGLEDAVWVVVAKWVDGVDTIHGPWSFVANAEEWALQLDMYPGCDGWFLNLLQKPYWL